MTTRSIEWRERDLERRAARQRTQIETSKLLTTFAVSASGAIVAGALQDGKSRGWTLSAVAILGLAFLAVVAVIALDRTTQVDQEKIVIDGGDRGWNDEQLLCELHIAFSASVKNNEAIVKSVQRCAQIQVVLAIASASTAVVSLLS